MPRTKRLDPVRLRAALVPAALAVASLVPLRGSAQSAEPTALPARFVRDQIRVAPVTERGDTITLFLDTGGGSNFLLEPSVRRLGLEVQPPAQGSDAPPFVALPAFRPGRGIPPAVAPSVFGQRLMVMPAEGEAQLFVEMGADGMLGRIWFADRVWTLDYPGRRLLLGAADTAPGAGRHRVPLGFQVDSAGRRTSHFPSIRVVVDGDSLDMLFDTGASVHPTDSALAFMPDHGPGVRGTSFVVASIYDRWRAEHPAWRVVERADRISGAPMIEVPEVEIAGHRVGPVWFTVRHDRNFGSEGMSKWMDRPVVGALGGSALRYFRIILDYPGALAIFER